MSPQRKIRVVRAVAGTSLQVGNTYLVTRREQGRGLKADAFFYRGRNGLHVRDWRVSVAILTGALQVVA